MLALRIRAHITDQFTKPNKQQKDMETRHRQKKQKTYNSGYSLVVTHLTTNPPVRCLNRAERTGSLVFNVLWSYVEADVK